MKDYNDCTPAPWRYEYGAVYANKEGKTVRLLLADREERGTAGYERDNNLRLSATAPELLESLGILYGHLENIVRLMPEVSELDPGIKLSLSQALPILYRAYGEVLSTPQSAGHE